MNKPSVTQQNPVKPKTKKESFILYLNYEEKFSLLSNEELGVLVRIIIEYEKTQVNPDITKLEPIVQMTFMFIKADLDRSRVKYMASVENGKLGGRPKTNNEIKTQQNLEEPNSNLDVVCSMKNDVCLDKRKITKEIVDYLNAKANTHYRSTTKTTKEHVSARLDEGFTLKDFKTVVDKKCGEWLGTEYEKFLCPTTLFSPSKFEKYLNQKVGASNGTTVKPSTDYGIKPL